MRQSDESVARGGARAKREGKVLNRGEESVGWRGEEEKEEWGEEGEVEVGVGERGKKKRK